MGCTGTLREGVAAFGFLPVPIAPWLLAALVLRIGCSLLGEGGELLALGEVAFANSEYTFLQSARFMLFQAGGFFFFERNSGWRHAVSSEVKGRFASKCCT